MKEYLKAQNKTNDAVIANTFSSDELERFSKADYRWANNRSKPYRFRTVSVNRILYQQPSVISSSSDTYKKIEELVLHKYFPSFMYEYTQLEQKLSDSEEALSEKEEALKSISSENKELKRQIEELNQKLVKADNQ